MAALAEALTRPSTFNVVIGKAFREIEDRRFVPEQRHVIRAGKQHQAVVWRVVEGS